MTEEELQKENAELKAQNKDLCNSLDIMNNRESELLAQIEKMASCNNCKFFDSDNYCKKKACIIHHLEGSCPKWEFVE